MWGNSSRIRPLLVVMLFPFRCCCVVVVVIRGSLSLLCCWFSSSICMLSKDSRIPPIPSEYLNKRDCMAPLIDYFIFRSDAGRSDTSRRAFFRLNRLLSLLFTFEFGLE